MSRRLTDGDIACARKLRERGASYAEIGAVLDCSSSAVFRRLNPERARAYRQGDDPGRERRRRWEQSPRGRGRCIDCGGLKGNGSGGKHDRCRPCSHAYQHDLAVMRGSIILGMWLDGWKGQEIADVMGIKRKSVSRELVNLRERLGWYVPRREQFTGRWLEPLEQP